MAGEDMCGMERKGVVGKSSVWQARTVKELTGEKRCGMVWQVWIGEKRIVTERYDLAGSSRSGLLLRATVWQVIH